MQRYKADAKQMRHEILLPREEISFLHDWQKPLEMTQRFQKLKTWY